MLQSICIRRPLSFKEITNALLREHFIIYATLTSYRMFYYLKKSKFVHQTKITFIYKNLLNKVSTYVQLYRCCPFPTLTLVPPDCYREVNSETIDKIQSFWGNPAQFVWCYLIAQVQNKRFHSNEFQPK